MTANEIASQIEMAWMEYNAAVVNRLHPEKVKTRLGNILINSIPEILAALRAYDEKLPDPVEDEVTLITNEAGEPPKKKKK